MILRLLKKLRTTARNSLANRKPSRRDHGFSATSTLTMVAGCSLFFSGLLTVSYAQRPLAKTAPDVRRAANDAKEEAKNDAKKEADHDWTRPTKVPNLDTHLRWARPEQAVIHDIHRHDPSFLKSAKALKKVNTPGKLAMPGSVKKAAHIEQMLPVRSGNELVEVPLPSTLPLADIEFNSPQRSARQAATAPDPLIDLESPRSKRSLDTQYIALQPADQTRGNADGFLMEEDDDGFLDQTFGDEDLPETAPPADSAGGTGLDEEFFGDLDDPIDNIETEDSNSDDGGVDQGETAPEIDSMPDLGSDLPGDDIPEFIEDDPQDQGLNDLDQGFQDTDPGADQADTNQDATDPSDGIDSGEAFELPEPLDLRPKSVPVPNRDSVRAPKKAEDGDETEDDDLSDEEVNLDLSMFAGRNCPSDLKTYRESWETFQSAPITSISLDITPQFEPRAKSPEELIEKRTKRLAEAPARDWRDRNGRSLGYGYFTDYKDGRVYISGGNGVGSGSDQSFNFRDLSNADLCFVSAWWGVPTEFWAETQPYQVRNFTMTSFTWKASGLCHKPLYFEEVQLERYGHSAGPVKQTFLSGAHFFGNILLLPYHIGLTPPTECIYDLGYYRPGNCAPWLLPAMPLSSRAARAQLGAITGGISLIP